ncbi:hypothetical protein VoSk93_49500 [Vibrio owensii]
MDNVLVSVVLPVFNAEKTIKEAISSILSQTYLNFELIIINDGSQDSSDRIINSFDDSRIKYIINDENLGLIKTLNKAFSLCSGKYIARMDSDDISEDERISKQVQFLENNLDYVAVGTKIKYFSDFSFKKKDFISPEKHNDILNRMFLASPLAHPSAMLRKDILDTYNIKYRTNAKHVEDYMLWVELSEYGKLYNIQESLLNYRISPSQISSVYSKEQREMALTIQNKLFCRLQSIYKVNDIKSIFPNSVIFMLKAGKLSRNDAFSYYIRNVKKFSYMDTLVMFKSLMK